MSNPLDVMKVLTGTQWAPGDGESATIDAWMHFVADTFPEMKSYALGPLGSYFSWCGATVAYCMAKSGNRPVFGSTDVGRFLWAQAWLLDGDHVTGTPQAGDVVIFDFGGGDHHVSLFEKDNGNGTWACRGGNQSHSVKVSNYSKKNVMGVRRYHTVVPVLVSSPAGTGGGTTPRQMHIMASSFGGSKDPNRSFYDNHLITDSDLGCALPYAFPHARRVRVFATTGKTVLVTTMDLGPWYDKPSDPYWEKGTRPLAETQPRDAKGRKTNKAGIDLTPAAWLALGYTHPYSVLTPVDWEFADESPVPVPVPVGHDVLWLQTQLKKYAGYTDGIDGDVGPLTIAAMIKYVEMTQDKESGAGGAVVPPAPSSTDTNNGESNAKSDSSSSGQVSVGQQDQLDSSGSGGNRDGDSVRPTTGRQHQERDPDSGAGGVGTGHDGVPDLLQQVSKSGQSLMLSLLPLIFTLVPQIMSAIPGAAPLVKPPLGPITQPSLGVLITSILGALGGGVAPPSSSVGTLLEQTFVNAHGVAWLQTLLNNLGAQPPLDVDGDWGPETEKALVAVVTKLVGGIGAAQVSKSS